MHLTLVHSDDVGVPQGGADLDLSLDVDPVQLVCDSLLADGLDGHLGAHSDTQTQSVGGDATTDTQTHSVVTDATTDAQTHSVVLM